MMRVVLRTAFLTVALAALGLFASPAHAQRTGDHIVPSIETVCDGDPYSFGLCNAYCEALDCESPTPLGTPRACSNLLRNYKKKSGGAPPPCACPCAFNLVPAIAALQDENTDGSPYDVDGADVFCNTTDPHGNTVEQVFNFIADSTVDEVLQGGIWFWLTDEQDPRCHELGQLIDDGVPDPLGTFWGPSG